MIRKIVQIDEEKCDGCGECVPACAEGAIRLEAGKARLAADALCDGLGACLGECPRGAITVIEREAADFDEAAVARHLGHQPGLSLVSPPPHEAAGCPGARAMSWDEGGRGMPATPRLYSVGPSSPVAQPARPRLAVLESQPSAPPGPPQPALGGSRLGQWPVQLHLISTSAPYFQGADLLVAADCVPFAYARFHDDMLAGRRVVIGCPKLDDNRFYQQKLTELFQRSSPASVTVVKMEVPCCAGIALATRQALAAAGRKVPYREVTVGVRGGVL